MPELGEQRALKHGRRCQALAIGKMPRKFSYIRRQLMAFKNQLDAALIKAKGQIDLIDAATVQTCLRAERHARLCERLLATETDLEIDQKANLSREAHKASQDRDKALARLGLDDHEKLPKGTVEILPGDPAAMAGK
jgi:hypothetical protein